MRPVAVKLPSAQAALWAHCAVLR